MPAIRCIPTASQQQQPWEEPQGGQTRGEANANVESARQQETHKVVAVEKTDIMWFAPHDHGRWRGVLISLGSLESALASKGNWGLLVLALHFSWAWFDCFIDKVGVLSFSSRETSPRLLSGQ